MSSTEQMSLGQMLREAIQEREEKIEQEALDGRGALYSKPTGDVEPTREIETKICLTCGRDLEHGLARVIGDNNGNVVGCSACFVQANGKSYDSDACAAQSAKLGTGRVKEEYR